MNDAGTQAILATRSDKGMLLVQRDGPTVSVAARARTVFDVSGAGDTVIAALTLAYASGLALEQAVHVANAAAGVVVSKRGTATASIEEVLRELGDQDQSLAPLPLLVSPEDTAARVAQWRSYGLRVGFTNGCFDLIHPGHVALLRAARAECDRLVVGLNSDASVRALKGPSRPINALPARAEVMSAIRHVDCVTSFDAPTPLELIRLLQPEVLVKGADYTIDAVVGADLVQAAGGRVVLVDLVHGQSTTAMARRMASPIS